MTQFPLILLRILLCVLLLPIQVFVVSAAGFSYSGTLKIQAPVLNGYYDIRATLWSYPVVTRADVPNTVNTHINVNSDRYLGFLEDQMISVNDRGEFAIQIGRFAALPKINPPRQIYLQLDVKRAGNPSATWETIDQNPATTDIERIGFFSSQIVPAISFQKNFGSFSGVLMDNKGMPLTGKHTARFSLWRSADLDTNFDLLAEKSFNTVSTNFVGYGAEVPFTLSPSGGFLLSLGNFTPIDSALLDDTLFLQVEIKKADEPMNKYEVIDPDGSLDTHIDRYGVSIKDGVITTLENTDGVANALGNTGKWLVSRIPGGTTSQFFELGAGNQDPLASMELRANQGQDPKGILRYNGYTNRWEISNDGTTFHNINDLGDILGTPNNTFTIGLGKGGDSPFALIFGEKIGAELSYDPTGGVFRLNRGIDFGGNQLLGAVFENLPTPPKNPKPGQQYFNTTDRKMYYFDGQLWQSMGNQISYFGTGGGGGGGSTTIINQTTGGGPISGTDSEVFTINQDASPGNTNVSIVAEQGSDPDGTIRYNATTNLWELSNNGGPFEPIVTTTGSQTLTDKVIDGDDNTLVDIDFSSLKPRVKSLVFYPQAGGLSVRKNGAGKGVLELDEDSVSKKNFYRWHTQQGTQQSLVLTLDVRLPEDFVSFTATPLTVEYRTGSTVAAQNQLDLALYDSTGAAVSLTGGLNLVSAVANTWATAPITFGGTPTFTPGSKITMEITVQTDAPRFVDIAAISFAYNGR